MRDRDEDQDSLALVKRRGVLRRGEFLVSRPRGGRPPGRRPPPTSGTPASGTPTSGVGAGAMSARRSGAGAWRVNGAVRAWLRSLEPSDWEIADVLGGPRRSEEQTSELQSQSNLVCRLLLEKKR